MSHAERVRAVDGPTRERRAPEVPERAAPAALSVVALAVVALTVAASISGLLVDGLYGDDATTEMLRGYDAVNALVVAPILAVAAWRGRAGGFSARLLSATALAYLAYTYLIYVFGTGFNDLFLLHAAVVATALAGLVLCLATLDIGAARERLRAGARTRPAAAVLGLLAVALAGMWGYFALDNAVTGDVPAGSRLVETATMVKLGMALDLTLLVPWYGMTAILLWRREPWGYVLGVVALGAGVLHQISYLVAMVFQSAADLPGAAYVDPGEPVVVLAYAVGCWSLLSTRRLDQAASRWPTAGHQREASRSASQGPGSNRWS